MNRPEKYLPQTRDVYAMASLERLGSDLRETAVDLARARTQCVRLLEHYSASPDRTAERLTLHLSTRLENLDRMACEAVIALDRLSGAVDRVSLTLSDVETVDLKPRINARSTTLTPAISPQ